MDYILLKSGKNRYPHMVNFNEHAIRLEPTAPGDGKYIHASKIRHTYGNFILAQVLHLLHHFRAGMSSTCTALSFANSHASSDTGTFIVMK